MSAIVNNMQVDVAADATAGHVAASVQVPAEVAAGSAGEVGGEVAAGIAGGVGGEVAAGIAGEVDGVGAPQPTYTADDDLEKGVPCYFPHCKFIIKGKCWSTVFNHARNRHGESMKRIKGTFLATKAREHSSMKNKSRYNAVIDIDNDDGTTMQVKRGKQKIKDGKLVKPVHVVKKESQGEAVDPPSDSTRKPMAQEQKEKAQSVQPKVKRELVEKQRVENPRLGECNGQHPQEGRLWIPTWVLCTAQGKPVQPVIMGGQVENVLHKSAAIWKPPTQKQDTLRRHLVPGSVWSSSTVKPDQSSTQLAIPSEATAGEELSQAIAVAEVPVVPNLLQEVHNMLVARQAKEDSRTLWRDELPHLRIRQEFLDAPAPPKKDGNKRKRCHYPSHLARLQVELPEFFRWFHVVEQKKEDYSTSTVKYACKVLGAFATEDCPISDVRVLLQLHISGLWKEYLALPVFGTNYGWVVKLIDSLSFYIDYHISLLQEKIDAGTDGPWEEHKSVLKSFQEKLYGGHRSAAVQAKEKGYITKQRDDAARIKRLPPLKIIRASLMKSFAEAEAICKHYEGKSWMPRHLRRRVNCIFAAASVLDTFGGRKKEWELLLFVYLLQHVVVEGNDYIVCTEHKTSATYGDIAKYLSPSLVKLIKLMCLLPRPEGWDLFLVPPNLDGHRVSIPSMLRCWCRMYLPADGDFEWPTVNLQRKNFHNTLMKLTASQEAFKQLMVKLDGHSVKVQNKHYILRDVADDIELAKELVFAFFHGPCCPWPEEPDTLEEDLEEMMRRMDDEDEADEQDDLGDAEEDDDDITLDWWEVAGTFFGVQCTTPKASMGLYSFSEVMPV